jgi:hypothetical protein
VRFDQADVEALVVKDSARRLVRSLSNAGDATRGKRAVEVGDAVGAAHRRAAPPRGTEDRMTAPS